MPSEPSGINSVGPPTPGSSPSQTAQHYLEGYEQQFKRARRTVKRRASRVTIATSILTGVLAVLGSVGALLASDWMSKAVAIATTTISATVAVLLAWNDHFHHRELWIQRSEVLSEINSLRRQYAVRVSLPWYQRKSESLEARKVMAALDEILKRDVSTWTQIQSKRPTIQDPDLH